MRAPSVDNASLKHPAWARAAAGCAGQTPVFAHPEYPGLARWPRLKPGLATQITEQNTPIADCAHCLIKEMAAEHRLWGAPRIRDESLK
jgi:hypothetical protein